MVKITPTGSALLGTRFLMEKSHWSPSSSVPMAISFAESMTLPPPTANTSSIPSSLQSCAPLRTSDSFGFGSTPPSSIKSIPLSCSDAVTVS